MQKTGVMKSVSIVAIAIGVVGTSSAYATDGYFQNGVGAKHKALAGAGTANVTDATGISINPAGLANVGHEVTISGSLFMPSRGFTGAGGPGFTPNGTIEGDETDKYLLPNIAYTRPLDETSTLTFSVSGNGGMSTDYAAVDNPACASPPLPASNGIFCGGEAGVDLAQIFFSAAYARDMGQWSFGIAPIFAYQTFEAKGLAAFGGATVDPAKLTNNGKDSSTGFGVRVGATLEMSENVSVGISYQSKLNMSEFEDYAGLFADAGDFDIPQSWNAGIAAKVTPEVTVMFDYRHINYESVSSIGNGQSVPLPFGSDDGPGFGWEDVDVFKLGVEWERGDDWVLRAGYSNNNNPVTSDNVTINTLAPGTVTDHFAAGFEKKMGNGHALEMALMYAPEEAISGIELTPAGPNPGHTIEPYLKELELTVGWKFNFQK